MQNIDEALALKLFPQRDDKAHKGTYKKVLVIGGSKAMSGALTLCATAAFLSGVGTITLLFPDVIYETVTRRIDWALTLTTRSDDDGFMVYDDKIKDLIRGYDIVIFGNGIGRSDDALKVLEAVLELESQLVIDADGLYLLGKIKKPIDRELILLPHLKEMTYLDHKDLKEVLNDPDKVLSAYLQNNPKFTIVLKSYQTIVSDLKERYLLDRPDSKLAKGGSGDILCGIIAGLLAQGLRALDACVLGVFIHNKMAAFTRLDPLCILPNELLLSLNEVFSDLRSKL